MFSRRGPATSMWRSWMGAVEATTLRSGRGDRDAFAYAGWTHQVRRLEARRMAIASMIKGVYRSQGKFAGEQVDPMLGQGCRDQLAPTANFSTIAEESHLETLADQRMD